MGTPWLRALAAWALALVAGSATAQAAGNEAPPPWACDKGRPGAHVLRFQSGIAGGEYKRFRAAWDGCFPTGYVGSYTLDLFSGGGVVDEALAIANFLVETFRNKPPLLMTRVSARARCVSACTFLFVAGQRRLVESGGSLEPHGFSSFLGTRADRYVLTLAKVVAERKQTPFCEIVGLLAQNDVRPSWARRTELATKGLRRALAGDRRLAWVVPVGELPGRTCADIERKSTELLKLTPERLDLMAHLDSVTAVTMPEVERAAALRAFRLQFAVQAGSMATDAVPLLDQKEGHLRWALDSYLEGINTYLEKSGQGPKLKDIDAAADDLRMLHDERIGEAAAQATGDLGTYLGRRRNDIDLPAFVKLMFSTSILYTRPLTREELCDHNLVNVGCD